MLGGGLATADGQVVGTDVGKVGFHVQEFASNTQKDISSTEQEVK